MHTHEPIQFTTIPWKNANRLAIDSPMEGLMSDLLQKVMISEHHGVKL